MSSALTDKVSFDFIRYANCWEDATILLEGLNATPASKILSIGSAGDNSFSLLLTDPELIVAVDVNKIQLHLIQLKKVAIAHFDYNLLLDFLGFRPADNRIQLFNEIKGLLDSETAGYWEGHILQIQNGIVGQGKFEKYFQFFSHKILPWIHRSSRTEELLKIKSDEAQAAFYDNYWNTFRWRLLFKIFFSKYFMGKYGRDPEFLKEVEVNVGAHIFKKAENQLRRQSCQQNHMLRYNLTGSFGGLLPHYLQPENHRIIRSNLNKLEIKQGYAEDAFKEYGKFKYMNLSNIFEYMNVKTFKDTAEQLIKNTEEGGRFAYWNLMVPRRISEIFPEQVEYSEELSTRLSSVDKGFFYNRFIVDQKK